VKTSNVTITLFFSKEVVQRIILLFLFLALVYAYTLYCMRSKKTFRLYSFQEMVPERLVSRNENCEALRKVLKEDFYTGTIFHS
jgi:hypothetical protein